MGFLEMNAAFAQSGKERELIDELNKQFTDDKKRNFLVLYGAYVVLAFSPTDTRRPLALRSAINRMTAVAQDRGVWRNEYHPDLVKAVKRYAE